MNSYLLEIGTEELPTSFLKTAPGELQEKIESILTENALAFNQVSLYSTPRRLTAIVEGLPEKQSPKELIIKGPPARIGLDSDGSPTQAAQGFAKKAGVDVSDFQQEEIDGEIYLVVRKTDPGRLVEDVLQEKLPDALLSLAGSHFMRWGSGSIKFSRPIRWVVSLWNDKHLPLSLEKLNSDTQSMGHRQLANQSIPIPNVKDYLSTIEEVGCVIVDPAKRKELILQQLKEAAQKAGGELPANEELLETINLLVENPWVITGKFDPAYLKLPREVIETVMAHHQKFFPVEDANGKLLPYFLGVSNGQPKAENTIREGYQRVLRARMEDAKFFFEDDQKTPLDHRLKELEGITFQKGIGNLFEKTQRLIHLSEIAAQSLSYSEPEIEQVKRAAQLCKADLVTGMVFELTELQGVMGQQYAMISGEHSNVCDGIFEHYLPRFNGDRVAKNPVGIAVSLADKIDTLVAVFSQEKAKLPSGSKDPLGLRRMTLGIIQTILENKLSINLLHLFDQAYDHCKYVQCNEETTFERLETFFHQRLKGVFLDQGFSYDVIDAVLEAHSPLINLVDTVERLELVKQLVQDEKGLKAVYEPGNRIYKILGDGFDPSATVENINPSLLNQDEERALFEAVQKINLDESNSKRMKTLQSLSPVIEAFFDKVLVNDKDEQVKNNRYQLLSVIHQLYLKIGLFSKLTV